MQGGPQRPITSDEGFAVFQSIGAEIFSEISSHDERDALELFDAITKICVRSHQDELRATESGPQTDKVTISMPSPTDNSLRADVRDLRQQRSKELCQTGSQISKLSATRKVDNQHCTSTQATDFGAHLGRNEAITDAGPPKLVPNEPLAAVSDLKPQIDAAMDVEAIPEQPSHQQNGSTEDVPGRITLVNHHARSSPRKSIARRPLSPQIEAEEAEHILQSNSPTWIVSSVQGNHENVPNLPRYGGLCDTTYPGGTAQIDLTTYLTQYARQYPKLEFEARQPNMELQKLIPIDCAQCTFSAQQELTVATTGLLDVPEHEPEAKGSPWVLPVLPDFEAVTLSTTADNHFTNEGSMIDEL